MKSSEIASPIDPDGALPIGDVRQSVYFALERGQQSIEYLICVARAQLLSRARAVNVEFEISGALAVDLDLSCRKSLVLVDRRLPGGEAAGKIKSYQISMDGNSGAFIGTITIGCSVGKGGMVRGSRRRRRPMWRTAMLRTAISAATTSSSCRSPARSTMRARRACRRTTMASTSSA